MTTDFQAPAGYASPLPVTPSGFGNALCSEWTKIRTVRSTMWTLGVMLVLVTGIGLLVAVVIRNTSTGGPHSMLGSLPALGAGFYGVLLGCLCVITLGVLVISSEYGTGMIRTTMTACPTRWRILAAKAVVFFLLAFTLTTAACTVVALIDDSLLTSAGAKAPTGADWLRCTVGIGLYVALLGLLALGVGALLRHSAGAITTMLGVVLLPIILALFMAGEALEKVRDALFDYSVPSALAAVYGLNNEGPQGWHPVLILAGVTAVVLAGAFAAVGRRDV